MSITPEHAAFYARLKAEQDKFNADFDTLVAKDIVAERAERAEKAARTGPTGPRTEAGKQKSRLNAYKHGLTGQIHLFTPEEKAEFAAHCQGILESLAPVGALETTLAQAVAEGHWRLKRSRSQENTLYAACQEETEPLDPDPQERRIDDAELQLRAWMTQHKHIELMTRYEGRIQRNIDRSMAELRTLKAERQKALEEELLLAELAESKGETYELLPNPLNPQFVFSAQEIRRALTRHKLLEEARTRSKTQKSQAGAKNDPRRPALPHPTSLISRSQAQKPSSAAQPTTSGCG